MNWQFSLNSLLLSVIACTLLAMLIINIFTRKDKSHGDANKYQPNLFSAIKDVLIVSMQKGQLPVAIVGIIFIVIAIRIPDKDIAPLLSHTLQIFTQTAALGWALSLVILFTSLMTAVLRSKKHKTQIAVIEKEKTQLLDRINILTEDLKRLSTPKTKNSKH